jgi:urease accessory protein
VLGRTREPGGTLTCRTRMTHNGTPALAEDLMLAPEQLGIGVLGTARILDTAVALGWRPPTPDQGTLFALHAPGSLVRDLVTEAHLSSIPAAWASWRDAIATPDAVKSRP